MNKSALVAPVGCLWVIGQIAAIGLHVITIILAFGMYGLVAACIVFISPGLSEIFFTGIMWSKYGFTNLYTMAAIGLALLFAVAFGLMSLVGDEKKQEETNGTSS